MRGPGSSNGATTLIHPVRQQLAVIGDGHQRKSCVVMAGGLGTTVFSPHVKREQPRLPGI
jgi:hypothetical protein